MTWWYWVAGWLLLSPVAALFVGRWLACMSEDYPEAGP